MTDNRNTNYRSGCVGSPRQNCQSFGTASGCGVIIDTYQVFDSCRDRDCFEDTRVYLDELGQSIIEHTSQVRTKSAEICASSISVDPVQLSRGFYRVTVRFYVKLELEACIGGIPCVTNNVCANNSCSNGCNTYSMKPQCFSGVAVVEKSVVLYGGEGTVHVFRSSALADGFCARPSCGEMSNNLPTAVVETVDPVVLGTRVVDPAVCCCSCCCSCSDIPSFVCEQVGNICDDGSRHLAVSLGFFSVIRIERPEQYLINAIEYSVPDKECAPIDTGSPCDAFRRMAFPTEEFAPGRSLPISHDCDRDKNDCGCK